VEGCVLSVVASSDSQAILLLCAPVALGDAKPLTPAEWAKLAGSIHASELSGPGALVGLSAGELGGGLALEAHTAERVAALLERGGTLAFELERLESRGIWVVARSDERYPEQLKRRLGFRAPALLFGAGRRVAMSERGVAVVGSRDASVEALAFAEELGRSVAGDGATVVSGGARGVDRAAMSGALDVGGSAVGVVADSLVRLTQQRETREALADERLTLLTPYAPEARFTVGQAMGRNKLIYCLADAAVVVATSAGSGGTWDGAVENLKAGWVPLWVADTPAVPTGNRELLARGGQPLASPSAAAVLDTQEPVAAPAPVLDDPLAALERALTAPRTEREVSEALGLGVGEARKLLREGVAAGRLQREGKPFRYVVVTVAPQASLFDAA
jgi:predicted Rossmann fold nucleotide-binding protein DprA/Smf involved in DNA uptake